MLLVGLHRAAEIADLTSVVVVGCGVWLGGDGNHGGLHGQDVLQVACVVR